MFHQGSYCSYNLDRHHHQHQQRPVYSTQHPRMIYNPYQQRIANSSRKYNLNASHKFEYGQSNANNKSSCIIDYSTDTDSFNSDRNNSILQEVFYEAKNYDTKFESNIDLILLLQKAFLNNSSKFYLIKKKTLFDFTSLHFSIDELNRLLKHIENLIEKCERTPLMQCVSDIPIKLTRGDGELFCKFVVEITLNCLKKLKKSEYNSEKALFLLDLLSNYTLYTQSCFLSDDLLQWISNLNFNQTLKTMFEHYSNINDCEFSLRKACINSILLTFINFTLGDDMILMNKRLGVIELAFKVLDKEDFFDKQRINDVELNIMLDNTIGFISNNTLLTETNLHELNDMCLIDRLKKHKMKLDEALSTYGKNNQLLRIVNSHILIILARLLNEDDIDKPKMSYQIVCTLLSLMNITIKQAAAENIESKFYYEYEIDGIKKIISLSILLECLLKICVSDQIKQIVSNLNGLETIINILKLDEDNKELCIELILSLCFIKSIKIKIQQDDSVMPIIQEEAVASKDVEISRLCRLVNDIVTGVIDKHIETKSAGTGKESCFKAMNAKSSIVMISYCNKDKEICKKLNDIFKSKGLKTWFDENNENILDSFVEAIDSAKCVLVCYSEQYKMNSKCRIEVEYALKCKKPIFYVKVASEYNIDGWLRSLIGNNCIIDVSNPDLNDNDSAIQKLIENIYSVVQMPVSKTGKLMKNEIKNEINESPVGMWSNKDVMFWFIKNGLVDWIEIFKEYDGPALLGLQYVQKRDFLYFCEAIESLLKEKCLRSSLAKKLSLFYAIDKNL